MITVIFGQPGSGKTTLEKRIECDIHLDGDDLRSIFKDTNFTYEGRIKNLNRASEIAHYLNSIGKSVVLSLVYPYKEARDYLNSLTNDIKWVYLEYKNEKRGKEQYHVIDFEIPESENILRIDTSKLDIDQSVKKISRYSSPDYEEKILLYVGAYRGGSVLSIINDFDTAYLFEPNPELYEELKVTFKNYDNVTIINAAASYNHNGEIPFYISKNNGESSSIYKPNPSSPYYDLIQTVKTINVKTINLFNFCLENNIKKIHTIVTDAQGHDFSILKTLKPFIDYRKIDRIQCEAVNKFRQHPYDGVNELNHLDNFEKILNFNYKLISNDNLHEHETDLIWEKKEFYGQFGQDEYLKKYVFRNKLDGFFVEIGAFDGITFSNTKRFEELGWKGICFEPKKEFFDALKSNRTADCYNVAVSDKRGKLKYLDVGMLGGLQEYYSIDHINRIEQEYKKDISSFMSFEVESVLFSDIVKQKHINLLCIDTEGSELSILQTIDFDEYIIDCICVEMNYTQNELHDFITSKDYRKIANLGVDVLYLRNDF